MIPPERSKVRLTLSRERGRHRRETAIQGPKGRMIGSLLPGWTLIDTHSSHGDRMAIPRVAETTPA